jgi:hypothetical protein
LLANSTLGRVTAAFSTSVLYMLYVLYIHLDVL